ncbi:MAG: LicD family protein [Bacteroidota bacterium]|nr:LicD family protein [Bacteroidota bacterium]
MINLKIDIPNDFLNAQERNGFLVSSKMKEVWAVELDLLSEFQRVANKYKIKYIASGGTMLGAVRHKGFIPWDDDVDIMMLREDYDKLISVAHEFSSPYFLQTNRNDKGYFRCFARLRNSLTTGIQKTEMNCHFQYNQGIFIDIFPMDNLVDNIKLFLRQQIKTRILLRKARYYSSLLSRFYEDKNKIKFYYRKMLKSLITVKDKDEKCLFAFEKECQRYNKLNTKKVSLLSFQFDNRIHDIERKDVYETENMDFEFLKVPVPKNYEKLLSWKYGNWQIPKHIPTYHGDVFFDTDKPYTNYI